MRSYLHLLFVISALGCCSRSLAQQASTPSSGITTPSDGEWLSVDDSTSVADPASTSMQMDEQTGEPWYNVESHGGASSIVDSSKGYSTIGEACGCVTSGWSCGGACGSSCSGYCETIEDGMRLCRFDLAYVSSDLLFIGRDADNFQLVGTDGGTQFFQESLSHGFEPGFRLNLGLRLWGNGFVEARHAMAGGWTARGNFQPLPGDPAAIAAQGTFEADYFSTDINLVAEDPIHQEYQWLLGLRYIEHSDSFDVTLNNSQPVPDVESYFGSVDNSMFGVHTGIRTGWFYRRSVWKVSLLGGILNNQIKQRGPRYTTALVLDGVADPTFSTEDQEVSIFADLEASVAYPICQSTFVRLGYQGIFMDNAVTVTNQQGSPANPDSLEFHGCFVGLEYYR
ncbi:MAG: hypothetical protein AAGG48_04840 [Planctomycetota bacterium]